MHGFPINMLWKIIFRIKCKLPFSLWPVRISILTTCVMWSCTGNFLIRARDCDIWINYYCPMRQFRWRSEIFFKLYHILGVKLVLTNTILSTIYQSILRLFWKCCKKYFTKSFLYYQQGNKSLILLHSERPKLYGVLAVLIAIEVISHVCLKGPFNISFSTTGWPDKAG